MNKFLLVGLLTILTITAKAQISWSKLGTAEKIWVILHPFSAKKAAKLASKSLLKLDSIKQLDYFNGNTLSGSKADALRHAYWMALTAYHVGPRRALWLGKAHEKKNKKDFENLETEEGYLPDFAAMQMDLQNNRTGVDLAEGCIRCTDQQLLQLCIELLEEGKLVYIKQNENGDFLNNNDQVIPKEEWSGKWINERMLYPTDL